MRMLNIPFDTTDWQQVESTEHAGATGMAYWQRGAELNRWASLFVRQPCSFLWRSICYIGIFCSTMG